ncbi:hypothetical protein C2845_PM04G10880 [Panicum miliaceum]|uniref:Uncharacterized protein n=1 Tax=Panicum miliaceum TaxID=4540 RepID=A0A3L6QVC4_PANMI|nr:hypothetical protein C2845_PM04G10880 [Panicum miliaceum]
MIREVNFDGLLKIACATIPSDFANWLMVECFDAESSELVFPGRGRISMIAESDILNLPTRAMSLGISLRCYPTLVDLTSVKKLNWCQFIVDQLKDATRKINKKNSVKGCLLLLVILYVDSLAADDVQIPTTKPRIAAWMRKLLDQVIKLDTNCDGSFDKLKIKRKIAYAVSKVLSGASDLLGTFIQDMAEAEDSPRSDLRRSKRRKTAKQHENNDGEEDIDEDSDYVEDEEEWISSSEDGSDQGFENEDAQEEEEEEDLVPLSRRLKRM